MADNTAAGAGPKFNVGEATATWLLHRFGPESLEGEHAAGLLKWSREIESAAPPPRLVPDRPSANAIGQAVLAFWNADGFAVYPSDGSALLKDVMDRAREIDAAAPPAEAPAERGDVDCFVRTMRTSKGPEFFVVVKHGDRELTPHMYAERWKAEYDVAEWQHVLNGAPKPDILAYGPESDAAPAGEWPARWFASGPEGEFFTDSHHFAETLIFASGRDRDDWTITDLSEGDTCAAPAAPAPDTAGTGYTYGHCDEHKRAGGCQRHNLQCGYPDCDRRPIEAPRVTGGREWRTLLDSPDKTGRYVVAHRGGTGGHAYYVHPSDAPLGRMRAGWHQMPDFRPTHWCDAPGGALQAATGGAVSHEG